VIENDLFQEHQALCHKLQMFINQARINEQKLARFQDLELRLISTKGLSELILQILNNYKQEFSLDTVTLTILDENYEIQRIIQDSDQNPDLSNLLFCHNLEQLKRYFKSPMGPVLGEFDSDKHNIFLSAVSAPIKSIANIPLLRYGKLIGSLNLGSESRERFSQNFGTEFLQRLATIVAICLENTTNHERLKRVGLTDSLTGVNNRRFFDQRLEEELARSLRSREPLACLFIDIDHFKQTNDAHGHQVGDSVLRNVARLIREQLRNSDVLGRYGGEEFSALLINTESRTAHDIAERIRIAIESYRFKYVDNFRQTQTLSTTISIGIGQLPRHIPNTDIQSLCDSLIKQADRGLYAAKSNGRNQVIFAGTLNASEKDTAISFNYEQTASLPI